VLLSLVSLKPVKADAVAKAEGNILLLDGILTGLHRGRRTGHVCTEVTQEPGRPFHFHKDEYRGEEPGEQFLALYGACWRHRGSERTGTLCGIQRTKATKLEEKSERESECPIVPINQGNLPEGTLGRKGGTVSWNL
jgi:hypothetical protein